jgi:hypothetical protein
MRGGGCSPLRTPSPTPDFPANREINREFRRIRLLDAILNADTPANSEACEEIPCATEQGIIYDRTGNLNPRAGNLILRWQMQSRTRLTGVCSHDRARRQTVPMVRISNYPPLGEVLGETDSDCAAGNRSLGGTGGKGQPAAG